VLLGAMAAVAILYFLPPQIETTVQTSTGQTETIVSYELVKLVALSLIAGAGGSVIMRSFVDRLNVLLEQQRAQAMVASAHEIVAQLPTQVTADLRDVLRSAVDVQQAAVISRVLQLQSKAPAASNPATHLEGLEENDQRLPSQYTSELEQALNQLNIEIERRFVERLQSRTESAEALLKTIEKKALADSGVK
jgi:hypothetical protein